MQVELQIPTLKILLQENCSLDWKYISNSIHYKLHNTWAFYFLYQSDVVSVVVIDSSNDWRNF